MLRLQPEFCGKERDTEGDAGPGLDYFGARYFSGAQGRFTTPDWSVKPSPVPYAKLDDPQTLNLYSYVRNNPLSRVDPDGHDDITYDQHGKEIDRQNKHGFWWHLVNNDNYSMKVGNQSFNLVGQDGPLKDLGKGSYTVVSASKTSGLMSSFVGANQRAFGEQPPNVNETIRLSETGGNWDFKQTLNKQFGANAFYIMNGSAYRSDYIGNVTWGQIMSSYGFTEDYAHFGAGVQQVYHDVKGLHWPTGSLKTGGDQPLDYQAIHQGYNPEPE